MGMFDTIVLPEPVTCPKCGTSITTTQTKLFESDLRIIQIGDVISWDRQYDDGVYEDTIYCGECYSEAYTVYFKIEKNVLVDVGVNERPNKSLSDIISVIAEQRTRAMHFIYDIAKALENVADYYYGDKKEKAKNFLKAPKVSRMLEELRFKQFKNKDPKTVLLDISEAMHNFLKGISVHEDN